MNVDMLRKLMRRRHLTQGELARFLGIDRSTFSRKLNNEYCKGFCIGEAQQIGAALGLSPVQMAELFFGE